MILMKPYFSVMIMSGNDLKQHSDISRIYFPNMWTMTAVGAAVISHSVCESQSVSGKSVNWQPYLFLHTW